jgi:hypothetical protein
VDTEIQALREAGGEDIEAWVIILYDAESEPPDANYCKAFRDGFGLDAMRVLYDPNLAMGIYGDRETSIVVDALGQIVSEHHSDALENIVAEIAAEL